MPADKSDKSESLLTADRARGLNRSGHPAYVSGRRLYLDKDGKVVEADSPDRLTLLVGENGTLSHARAVEVGLVNEDGSEVKPAKAPHRPHDAPRDGAGLANAPAAGKPNAGHQDGHKAKG